MVIYVSFLSLLFVIILMNKALSSIKTPISNSLIVDVGVYKNKKKLNERKILFSIFVSIIFLFSALRFNVGWDYSAYYETIKYGLSTNIVNNGELLTILLVNISKSIREPQLYFIINSAICIFLISSVAKKYSKDPWMSMIIFVTFPLFYLNSFSVIRNFSAIAITFYASRFILEKKMIKYITAIVIASQFHTSALIAIVFYPLKYIEIKNSRLILLIAITPIISRVMRFAVLKFTPQYSIYLNKTAVQGGTKGIIVFLVIAAVIIFLMKYLRRQSESEVAMLHYNNFIFGLMIYLMFFETGTMGHRLSLYGTISSIILIPEIVYIFKNYKDRLLIKIIVYSFFSIFFIYIIKVGSATYIPYEIFINYL